VDKEKIKKIYDNRIEKVLPIISGHISSLFTLNLAKEELEKRNITYFKMDTSSQLFTQDLIKFSIVERCF
jgi:hypothetical protein